MSSPDRPTHSTVRQMMQQLPSPSVRSIKMAIYGSGLTFACIGYMHYCYKKYKFNKQRMVENTNITTTNFMSESNDQRLIYLQSPISRFLCIHYPLILQFPCNTDLILSIISLFTHTRPQTQSQTQPQSKPMRILTNMIYPLLLSTNFFVLPLLHRRLYYNKTGSIMHHEFIRTYLLNHRNANHYKKVSTVIYSVLAFLELREIFRHFGIGFGPRSRSLVISNNSGVSDTSSAGASSSEMSFFDFNLRGYAFMFGVVLTAIGYYHLSNIQSPTLILCPLYNQQYLAMSEEHVFHLFIDFETCVLSMNEISIVFSFIFGDKPLHHSDNNRRQQNAMNKRRIQKNKQMIGCLILDFLKPYFIGVVDVDGDEEDEKDNNNHSNAVLRMNTRQKYRRFEKDIDSKIKNKVLTHATDEYFWTGIAYTVVEKWYKKHGRGIFAYGSVLRDKCEVRLSEMYIDDRTSHTGFQLIGYHMLYSLIALGRNCIPL